VNPAVANAATITDDMLRQIDAARVSEEFDAIIAANWPTEPPEPPPAAGASHPEPPHPRSLAHPQPQGRLTDPGARAAEGARQRAPPRAVRGR